MQLHYPKSARIAFCSDVHLSGKPQAEHSQLEEHFLTQLIRMTHTQNAVFILGDLFDYWVGDACSSRFQTFFSTFKKNKGPADCFFMPGNRDFLISHTLLHSLNIAHLTDPSVLCLGNTRLLLTHGDRLCTHDRGYQWLRSVLQHPATLWLASKLPYQLKLAVAKKLRRSSTQLSARKPKNIMQACTQELRRLAEASRCHSVVFGHVHTQHHQLLEGKTPPIEAYTMDCWQHQPNWLLWDNSELQFFHCNVP